MHEKPTHPESDVIACEICLKEIPRDLAKTSESAEYVHYFCGESCYVQWRKAPEKPDGGRRGKS